jgi:hypothetical protein
MSLGVLQSSNVCLINELPEPKQTLLEKIIMLFSLFEIATVNDTYIGQSQCWRATRNFTMANIIAYNNFISEKHFICLVLIECRFVKRDANETSKYIIRAASIATKRTKVNADLADRTSFSEISFSSVSFQCVLAKRFDSSVILMLFLQCCVV